MNRAFYYPFCRASEVLYRAENGIICIRRNDKTRLYKLIAIFIKRVKDDSLHAENSGSFSTESISCLVKGVKISARSHL